ncbi:uncharacterized protein LOC101857298 [Aplysia californica]|uniref:Uncharacterized protein LOC101857298 n=1 Tax=Aplysia californica TaxID=6500 RepID=A0ABM0JCF9_APLCA|nr:uncharacterized protein LOC101857298 [Aplysia californica]
MSTIRAKSSSFAPLTTRSLLPDKLSTLLIKFLLVCCLCFLDLCQADKKSLLRDIDVLASELPGTYSNVRQYRQHAQGPTPPGRRPILLRSELYRISSPLFNDSLTLYFQDFTRFQTTPFRSGFYSFVADTKSNSIRMKTYRLRKGVFLPRQGVLGRNASKANQQHLDSWQDTDVISSDLFKVYDIDTQSPRTHSACDMFWKRIARYSFAGVTGPVCLASLGRDKIRIGVSMTLAKNKLMLTEGWYKVKDGTRITEVKVPYILKKIPKSKSSHPQAAGRLPGNKKKSKKEILSNETTKKEKKKDKTKNKKKGKSGRKGNNKRNRTKYAGRRRLRARSRSHHRLRMPPSDPVMVDNFIQVVHALKSGRELSFLVNLSACSPQPREADSRTLFGGKVKDFVYVSQDGNDYSRKSSYVFFTTETSVVGNNGVETIRREYTLYLRRRVFIRVVKFRDEEQPRSQVLYMCKLYRARNGKGAVKMFYDPDIQVVKATSLAAMTSALDEGRALRVITDLGHCAGQMTGSPLTVGGIISDFNMVNGGRALELLLPIANKFEGSDNPRGLSGSISITGEVPFVRVGGPRPSMGKQLYVNSAYTCTLSSSNVVYPEDEKLKQAPGVRVYYHGS